MQKFSLNVTGRRRVRRGQSGAIAIITGLVLVVLVGGAGLAIDTGALYSQRRSMQAAADAAALSAAQEVRRGKNATEVRDAGRSASAMNGFTHAQDGATITINWPPTSGPHSGDNRYVQAIVNQPNTPFLMGVLGVGDSTVGASSEAAVLGSTSPCILTLQTSGTSIELNSNSIISAANCEVFANSSNSSAIKLDSNSRISAESTGTVGGSNVQSNSMITPTAQHNQSAQTDPFASLAQPTVGSCNHTNRKYNSGNRTVSPGVYCNGIELDGNANLTMNPGTYIFVGRGFYAKSNHTITGSGVTIFHTENASYEFQPSEFLSNSIVTLSAPTTGTYTGILYFQDPDITTGETWGLRMDSNFGYQSSQCTGYLHGAIYLPKAGLYMKSNSCILGDTYIVSRTLSMDSNAVIRTSWDPTKPPSGGGQSVTLTQ